MEREGAELGLIVRGSLAQGLEMKLADGRTVEDVRAGRFVVVEGAQYRFFSMITNVSLAAANPQLLLDPPRPEETLHRRVLAGTAAFGAVELRPMLMLPAAARDENERELLPVKTIPPHFSAVYEATREDVSQVFGSDSDRRFWHIGAPLDMEEIPVCLDLERFVERSNAIFGKSGTGKTFLTRICLCGIIRAETAVNLVFDMHSEYGWKGSTEDADRAEVRGLKQLFPERVLVCSLDPESSRRRDSPVELEVRIPYSQVTIDDVALLGRELNLNPAAVETAYLLLNEYQDQWLGELLKMDAESLKEFAAHSGAHEAALGAIKRKLNVLASSCEQFLKPSIAPEDDAVMHILSALESGKHVVLEFGRFSRPVQYMLVANILTRRIHEAYTRKTEEALGKGLRGLKPLVITVEEAHKFLAPSLAEQTIFGTIAREMRKYNVTLLIVDQRPSGIDDEVLSQVGTRLICLLDDERDVQAALSGISGESSLRSVLASLETRQQALILGHAVPMPIVVRTRTYDDESFRQSLGEEDESERRERTQRNRELDFPE